LRRICVRALQQESSTSSLFVSSGLNHAVFLCRSFIAAISRERSKSSYRTIRGEWFRGTSWSPDGRRLAGYIHRSDNTPAGIAVYSFDSSAFEKLVNFGESPLWLNDGRRLLFQLDGVIYLLDSRSKEVQQIATVQPNTIYDPPGGLSR
jgi:hypothetical protein